MIRILDLRSLINQNYFLRLKCPALQLNQIQFILSNAEASETAHFEELSTPDGGEENRKQKNCLITSDDWR